ncbi:MAG: AAA family ATPase [Chitinophagaceae bacterium]
MHIAAIYIPKNSFPHIFGINHEEITINLGGFNLYKISNFEIIHVESNNHFIDDLVSDQVRLFSCFVGANGGGKTTLLQFITSGFFHGILEQGPNDYTFTNDFKQIHRVYYTPYLRNGLIDAVGNNGKDLSKFAMMTSDNHEDRGGFTDFMTAHESENSKRWIKFNSFYKGLDLKNVRLPHFEKVELSLRHLPINRVSQKDFHDTPYQIQEAIGLLFEKFEKERKDQETEQGQLLQNTKKDQRNWHFPRRFEFDLYETAIGKLASVFEKLDGHYLDKSFVPEDFESKILEMSSREAIAYFLISCGLIMGKGIKYSFDRHLVLLELLDTLVSIADESKFTDNWRKIHISEEECLTIIELYDKFNTSFLNAPFHFDSRPMFNFLPTAQVSSGEQQFLNMFSTLYYHSTNIQDKIDLDTHSSDSLAFFGEKVILLLDEGDNAFHPQWKKQYVHHLRAIIPAIFPRNQIQIVITSHDPLTLSDIPKNNAIFLEKGPDGTRVSDSSKKHTFGGNLSDLLKDSFFLQDDQIGSHAAQVIDQIIKDIRRKQLTDERIQQIQRLIDTIDEPIVKFKLAEMLSEATGDNQYERSLIDKEISRLQERKNEL